MVAKNAWQSDAMQSLKLFINERDLVKNGEPKHRHGNLHRTVMHVREGKG